MSPASFVGLVTAVAVLTAAAALSGSRATVAVVRTRRRVVRAGLARSSGPAVGGGRRPLVPWSARRAGGRLVDLAGRADRMRRRADRALPLLLDHVTRQLRSGASLSVAVHAAALGSDDLSTRRMAAELGAGAGLTPAVDGWRAACPTPARALAAAALTLAADAGGSVALVLDGVTDTLRDRVALEREVAALSSQARASAAVLVVAPLVFAALAAAADRRVADVLLRSPIGWACVAAGLVLDALGALWMSRLAGRSR